MNLCTNKNKLSPAEKALIIFENCIELECVVHEDLDGNTKYDKNSMWVVADKLMFMISKGLIQWHSELTEGARYRSELLSDGWVFWALKEFDLTACGTLIKPCGTNEIIGTQILNFQPNSVLTVSARTIISSARGR